MTDTPDTERRALLSAAAALPGLEAFRWPLERLPDTVLQQLLAGAIGFDDIGSEDLLLTGEQEARMRPAREALGDAFVDGMMEGKRKPGQRGPQKAPTKIATSVRLDRDVHAALVADGPGWQARMNTLLRKGLGLE